MGMVIDKFIDRYKGALMCIIQTESYPTMLRSYAIAIVGIPGRFASIIAPFMALKIL